MSPFDIHQRITDQILRMLESAEGSYELPWRQGASLRRPVNASTGKRYRGVNVLTLWAAALERGYSSGVWASFNQWTSIGAQVRKGERASYVVFYKPLGSHEADETSGDAGDSSGQPRGARVVLRSFAVFAAEQVTGFVPPAVPRPALAERLKHVDDFVTSTGAEIRESDGDAFYRPLTDTIHMPAMAAFLPTAATSAAENYYSVLLHELVHWSGAPNRCERDILNRFGSQSYAMEELVAELGAAFLCADLAISSAPRPNHAHYLRSWLQVLKDDKRAIFLAASKASQAAAFLESLQPEHPLSPESGGLPAEASDAARLASAS